MRCQLDHDMRMLRILVGFMCSADGMRCSISRAKTKLVVSKMVLVAWKFIESFQDYSLKNFADRTKETSRKSLGDLCWALD
jgi:hypothetical protein